MALVALVSFAGCHWLNPDKCPDLPCGAISAPPGSSINEWATAQAARAEADDFVVYEADWVAGGVELGPSAQRRIAAAAERVAHGESPLVISTSGDDNLDLQRSVALQNYLATQGYPNMASSISVGWPAALDLLGREAPNATRDLINSRQLPNSPFSQQQGSAFGNGAISTPLGPVL